MKLGIAYRRNFWLTFSRLEHEIFQPWTVKGFFSGGKRHLRSLPLVSILSPCPSPESFGLRFPCLKFVATQPQSVCDTLLPIENVVALKCGLRGPEINLGLPCSLIAGSNFYS
jgi:hypothetical protein